jgi:hypothetical protein
MQVEVEVEVVAKQHQLLLMTNLIIKKGFLYTTGTSYHHQKHDWNFVQKKRQRFLVGIYL